jgi:hypothetical protein
VKLLIVLPYDEYLRNYLQTGAFRELERSHECFYAVTDRCMGSEAVRALAGFVGTIKIDKRADKQHYELFNVLTWRHRKRSRTFYYRFSRFYKTYPNTKPLHVLRNLKGALQASKYVALGNRWAGRLAIPWLTRRIAVNADLERIAREVRPDIALLPCSAYDPLGNDVARLGKSLGFKTLFLVDNWDNLSSKSIFWAAPDFLGVWGEQSREHAAQIHSIDRGRVVLLGTPRFEAYYQVVKERVKSPYPFPYILFCGAALAFNELEALTLLDQELERNAATYGDLKIVYRPHPYRQERLCPDRFRQQDYRHVVLDQQMAATYYERGYPAPMALDYYPALLASAKAVVCPLTTMLVEALICRTPVLAIVYDDGLHYTSPHNAYRFYLHFEGLERMVGLELNRERARLGENLRSLISNLPVLEREHVDASLEYFIHRDSRTYAQRLVAAVDEIGAPGATRWHA